jgi:uncharacterized membrane protein YhaH (DUF805 family)
VTFSTAIRSCLTRYAQFSGRARRSEYWLFNLFAFLITFATAVLDVLIGVQVFTVLAILGLLLPVLAVTVRRLHDTDHSGAWVLINLLPFGAIVLFVFICIDSRPYPNRFGPSPKQLAGVPGWPPYGQPPYPPTPYGYGQPRYPQRPPAPTPWG